MSKKFKSKKLNLICMGFLTLALVVGLCGCGVPGTGLLNNDSRIPVLSGEEVIISPNGAASLELVDFDCENFSMKIPQGWVVETGGFDMFYAIRAYDPNDGRYQIFSILKAEPFLKSDMAKDWYESYYASFGGEGNRLLAEATVLYSPTVENFYCNFNDYAKFCKSVEPSYANFKFPNLKNFAAIESFESNTAIGSMSCDDKTLRGSFQTSDKKNGEGLFMASIIDNGSYITMGFDALFYSAYNIMGISAAENELINYQPLLTEALASLQYKDSFISTTISNGQERTQTALSINNSMQQVYDSYNSAWSSRQKSYDISSQKQSDATLGYERVYDTETNEIYKAYNGFTDDYDGEKYKPITEDMYSEAVDGYIEKK